MMIEEVWNVLRHEWRQVPLSRERVIVWINRQIERNGDVFPPMLIDIALGKRTDIEEINGVTNPFLCLALLVLLRWGLPVPPFSVLAFFIK